MSGTRTGRRAHDVADWLSLAATPAFATMALLTSKFGSNAYIAQHEASEWAGMAAMYVLMSIFHSAPWLRLTADRLNGARER